MRSQETLSAKKQISADPFTQVKKTVSATRMALPSTAFWKRFTIYEWSGKDDMAAGFCNSELSQSGLPPQYIIEFLEVLDSACV